MLANPKNCEIIILGHDGLGRMKLDGRCELVLSQRPAGGGEEDDSGDGDDDHDESGGQKSRASFGRHSSPSNTSKTPSSPTPSATTVVTGYEKHSRLRTIPPQWMYPRKVRMCYEEKGSVVPPKTLGVSRAAGGRSSNPSSP